MNQLPTIRWKNRVYTFDYRLQELRSITKKGMKTVTLNRTETELLQFALNMNSKTIIRSIMHDLNYKGV